MANHKLLNAAGNFFFLVARVPPAPHLPILLAGALEHLMRCRRHTRYQTKLLGNKKGPLLQAGLEGGFDLCQLISWLT